MEDESDSMLHTMVLCGYSKLLLALSFKELRDKHMMKHDKL
jgi:hypothetical protein